MPIREVLLLSFESLRANKLRSSLTMLGMVIGVAAVILLVSIGNGARNYINDEFEGLGTNLIVIQPGKRDGSSTLGPPIGNTRRPLTLNDVEAIEKQANSVEAVTPLMVATGTIKYRDKSANEQILGGSEAMNVVFIMKVQYGAFFNREEVEAGRRVAILGNKIAHELFGNESAVGQLVRISDSEHRIVAVLESAGEKLGFDMDHMVLIPTKDAMRLFNEDKLFGIRAKARSRAGMDDAVDEIQRILKNRHNGNDDFTIVTQVAIMGTLGTIMGMLTYVLAGIAMISMLVGGIGIMNIMLVSVTERTREIGIRRAVGARRRDILKQFLWEAILLSVLAGLIGVLGSLALTHIISLFTPKFNMRAPFWILPPAFLVSLGTGVIFGVWPARKASKIQTIDALRYE